MTRATRLAATGVAVLWGVSSMATEADVQATPDPKAVASIADFTLDLYKEVATAPGNVFCSPLNVAVALDMTAAGARGETAEQITQTLHLDGVDDEALGRLVKTLGAAMPTKGEADGQGPGLWTANAGWFAETENILPAFTERLIRAYQAEPHRVDFAQSPNAAREFINAWVADQTRDRIRDLLKPGHVTPSTRFVLTSAIYFKADWAFPFKPEATTDESFHADGGPVPVKLMNQTVDRIPYFEDETVQVATLPYKGGSIAMTVVLPKRRDGLAAVEAELTSDQLRTWTATPRPTRLKLALPRFKSTTEFELKDALAQLGLTAAFDPARADFSGINGERDLFLSAVVHKAFVEVEEKGTEAAAATAVVGVRSSALLPSDPIVFRADHPFLYLIRDVKSGAILFIGRLSR